MQNCKVAFLSHCQIGPAPPPPPATEYRRFSTTQSQTTIPVELGVAVIDDDDSKTIHQSIAIDFSVVDFAFALHFTVRSRAIGYALLIFSVRRLAGQPL